MAKRLPNTDAQDQKDAQDFFNLPELERRARKGDRQALVKAEEAYKKIYGNAKNIGTYNKKIRDLSESYANAVQARPQARREAVPFIEGIGAGLIGAPMVPEDLAMMGAMGAAGTAIRTALPATAGIMQTLRGRAPEGPETVRPSSNATSPTRPVMRKYQDVSRTQIEPMTGEKPIPPEPKQTSADPQKEFQPQQEPLALPPGEPIHVTRWQNDPYQVEWSPARGATFMTEGLNLGYRELSDKSLWGGPVLVQGELMPRKTFIGPEYRTDFLAETVLPKLMVSEYGKKTGQKLYSQFSDAHSNVFGGKTNDVTDLVIAKGLEKQLNKPPFNGDLNAFYKYIESQNTKPVSMSQQEVLSNYLNNKNKLYSIMVQHGVPEDIAHRLANSGSKNQTTEAVTSAIARKQGIDVIQSARANKNKNIGTGVESGTMAGNPPEVMVINPKAVKTNSIENRTGKPAMDEPKTYSQYVSIRNSKEQYSGRYSDWFLIDKNLNTSLGRISAKLDGFMKNTKIIPTDYARNLSIQVKDVQSKYETLEEEFNTIDDTLNHLYKQLDSGVTEIESRPIEDVMEEYGKKMSELHAQMESEWKKFKLLSGKLRFHLLEHMYLGEFNNAKKQFLSEAQRSGMPKAIAKGILNERNNNLGGYMNLSSWVK